ncbi:cytochrome c [Methylocystis sp. IM3]|jgi:mono/diheme cytochrome c family protein|uniref:c-type cytochrome n=1 Tax=unclassified Methylocystis TaxID=2625913 RepID=UPI000FB7C180|nr:MAG: c-type cytochrome [Hyphomicrobiales bacterium]
MASVSRASILLGLAGAAALIAVPAAAGDAQKGAAIAKRWCASCHVVSKDQSSANADAPSFFDVAKRRTDRKQLGNFLMDPHPPMPDMHLSRKEIEDIVSYIRSLDPRPQPKGDPDGKDEELPKNG